MVVDDRDAESGQSILEFLLMLPMLVGLTIVLVRVNQAIQVSIVNQQYARMQSLWLAFNSPVYPALKLNVGVITAQQENQQIILVAGNQAPADGSNIEPEAATSYVARKQGLQHLGDGDPDATQRALVHVRDTVTLCTQSNVVRSKSGYIPILPMSTTAPFAPTGNYSLSEDVGQFDFCHGGLQYLVDAKDGGQ